MTHRVFSRNASSSRAIPVERMIEDVLRDPATPTFWGKNQAGMQAREECDAPVVIHEPDAFGFSGGPCEYTRAQAWFHARDQAVETARAFAAAGYHKQIVNRIIEPWCHINVVVTATEWDNFFALRCHPDAQPEMRALAEAMRDARNARKPFPREPGQWHLPYVDEERDRAALMAQRWAFLNHPPLANDMIVGGFIRLSVARCARVSYLTHEGKPPDVAEDLKLYDRLVGATPLHASPAEHQATPDEFIGAGRNSPGWWRFGSEHGNFTGWRQYRKRVE